MKLTAQQQRVYDLLREAPGPVPIADLTRVLGENKPGYVTPLRDRLKSVITRIRAELPQH